MNSVVGMDGSHRFTINFKDDIIRSPQDANVMIGGVEVGAETAVKSYRSRMVFAGPILTVQSHAIDIGVVQFGDIDLKAILRHQPEGVVQTVDIGGLDDRFIEAEAKVLFADDVAGGPFCFAIGGDPSLQFKAGRGRNNIFWAATRLQVVIVFEVPIGGEFLLIMKVGAVEWTATPGPI